MEPKGCEVRSLSVSAARLTISRQRPRYCERPTHCSQKFIVSLKDSEV